MSHEGGESVDSWVIAVDTESSICTLLAVKTVKAEGETERQLVTKSMFQGKKYCLFKIFFTSFFWRGFGKFSKSQLARATTLEIN